MFDIGFWEIMLIAILALVVIGPERLPGVARAAGKWVGKTRRFIEGVKGEVESEFDTSELKRLLHNQEVQIKELQNKLGDEVGDIRSGFSYNLDDDGKSEKPESSDDYLEFLDEDEEKDHEQIAAEKAEKARLQQEKEQQLAARESRTFENPAVASKQSGDQAEATEKDKQNTQHDG